MTPEDKAKLDSIEVGATRSPVPGPAGPQGFPGDTEPVVMPKDEFEQRVYDYLKECLVSVGNVEISFDNSKRRIGIAVVDEAA